MRYVALDLDKNDAYVGIFDSETQQRHQERVPLMRDPISLNRFVESLRPDDVVVMEAQPCSFFLHDLFKPMVKDVHILESHWFGGLLDRGEVKNDRNDTGVMLDCAQANVLRTVWVPSEEVRAQRLAAMHYRQLDKERTRAINRCHAILTDYGLASLAAELLKTHVKRVVIKLQGRMPRKALTVLASTMRLLRSVEEELSLARAEIEATIQPQRDIVVTLPGMDSIFAHAALACIGDVTRFKTADSLTNYCLAPSLNSTGGKTRHGRTKRRGSALLRWAMVEAANCAKRSKGKLGNFYLKKQRSRGHHKAIVALARKMLEILWHMLTKNEPYRDVQPEAALRKQQRRNRKFHQAQQVLRNKPDPIETLKQNIGTVREIFQIMARE
jgi:transposase